MSQPFPETLDVRFQKSLERWMDHKKNCPECEKNKARTACTIGDGLLEEISQLQWHIASEARKSA